MPNITELLAQGADAIVDREYSEAAKLLTKVIRYATSDTVKIKALTFRGEAYSGMGDYHKAKTDLDDAIDIQPAPMIAYISYYERGIVKCNLGEFDDAIQDFNIAIKTCSAPFLAHCWRAAAKAAIGDCKGANEDFVSARDTIIQSQWFKR